MKTIEESNYFEKLELDNDLAWQSSEITTFYCLKKKKKGFLEFQM